MTRIYKTLVIDDEPPARKRLLNLLENFTDTFEVIGVAENGLMAKEKIESLKPDLIFLDIEMPELTGFELLETLTYIPIVIFCTAYDQYSLQAFETNSIDYLVKPVRLERLQQSVNKLKQFSKTIPNQNILGLLKELSAKSEKHAMTSITVKKDDKLVFIKLEEVSHFSAEERYVAVHAKEGVFLTEEPLSQLEQKLPPNFLRVHRAAIINKDEVKDVQKYFNSRYVITLQDKKGTKITTGRSYKEMIKTWVDV
ncbi:two component transcriptional regulator, LytTR family [Salegentibacter holothuriorum]|uniref:Two component transcriptional regulator, LytTR family n=1 Tax=Salegentibacter holothuriorum TaxID=241145 RepID=A0A1T5DFT4_9FLAO|nr:LytTR family DNA-binding domain-containing protein [Salegentibacter holothuriorum]SKB70536.1 two component transcriptional regulator, LytTR family [Salegentibacter holothuriorum]